MVQEDWFQAALKLDIDMFVVIGHNPVRGSGSTFPTVLNAIRAVHPNTPVQIFGGHTHIRDFKSYDNTTTSMEAGRYCETLGWVSISGLKNSNATKAPVGVPNPSRPALNGTVVTKDTLLYSR